VHTAIAGFLPLLVQILRCTRSHSLCISLSLPRPLSILSYYAQLCVWESFLHTEKFALKSNSHEFTVTPTSVVFDLAIPKSRSVILSHVGSRGFDSSSICRVRNVCVPCAWICFAFIFKLCFWRHVALRMSHAKCDRIAYILTCAMYELSMCLWCTHRVHIACVCVCISSPPTPLPGPVFLNVCPCPCSCLCLYVCLCVRGGMLTTFPGMCTVLF